MPEHLRFNPYFVERVLEKRPEIDPEWCIRAIRHPDRVELQPDGRIRCWKCIPEYGNRYLRVILLADGVTILNAFFDRTFKP